MLFDLNTAFLELFIDKKSRTHDQMTQACRSGKQCIAEGYEFASLKGYIKLLGVSKGSFTELGEDFQDFLRTKGLQIWDKDDPRVKKLRDLRVMRDESGRYYIPQFPHCPHDPELSANLLLTLCKRLSYLLDRQIISLEEKFINEGGYTEKLFQKRLAKKND